MVSLAQQYASIFAATLELYMDVVVPRWSSKYQSNCHLCFHVVRQKCYFSIHQHTFVLSGAKSTTLVLSRTKSMTQTYSSFLLCKSNHLLHPLCGAVLPSWCPQSEGGWGWHCSSVATGTQTPACGQDDSGSGQPHF